MLPEETITELLSIIKTQQPAIWDKFVGTTTPPDPPTPPTTPLEPILPVADEDFTGQLVISKPGTYTLSNDIVSTSQGIIITCGDVTLNGNGHVIEFNTGTQNGVWGIHVCTADWAAEDQILPTEIRKLIKSPVQNITIKNCCIRYGGIAAAQAHGIGGRQANNVVIENNIIEVGGRDTQTIFFKWGTPTINDNLLIVKDQSTADRHLGPCNVGAQAINAKNNILFGGNSGFKCDNGSDIKIQNNFICNNSYATNGYGVWLYNCQRVDVSHNTIYPIISGRGVLINDGKDMSITDNRILAYEQPNVEFGEDLNACGIRIRYNTQNIKVLRNDICAVGGDEYCSSSALYLTLHKNSSNLLVQYNNLHALLLEDSDIMKKTAKTITFEGSQDGKLEVSLNNIITSQYIFGLSGYDGPGKINPISIIENNTLGVLDIPANIKFNVEDYEVIAYINDIWKDIKKQYIEFLTYQTLDYIMAELKEILALTSAYVFFSGYTSGDEYIKVGNNDESLDLLRVDGWPTINIQNGSLAGARYLNYNSFAWVRQGGSGPYNQVRV